MRGEGFNKPTIFMPWTGEYGVMLMYWIRFIHHTKAPHKIVCCKRGDEPYFPHRQMYMNMTGQIRFRMPNVAGLAGISLPDDP